MRSIPVEFQVEGRSIAGGRVFAGPDADLKRLETYYVELGKASGAFYSHVYRRDNVLVQINGKLKDEQATKYEAALKGMK